MSEPDKKYRVNACMRARMRTHTCGVTVRFYVCGEKHQDSSGDPNDPKGVGGGRLHSTGRDARG